LRIESQVNKLLGVSEYRVGMFCILYPFVNA
jgi:hypothetical protein